MSVSITPDLATNNRNKVIGYVSLLLITIGLVVFAISTHIDLLGIGNDFISVFLGNFTRESLTLGQSVVTILHFSLIVLMLNLLIIPLIPHGKSISLTNIFNNGPLIVYVVIIIEEVVIRWLILGVIGISIFHAGPLVMFLLILIGNIIWAGLHLHNYKDPTDRKIFAVLPQFLTGFIFAFLFLQYGFVVCLFVHLTYDFILMATDKQHSTLVRNGVSVVYWLLLAGVIFLITNSTVILPSLTPWLNNNLIATTQQLLPMAVLMLYALCTTGVISNLLCLDYHQSSTELSEMSFAKTLLTLIIASAISIGLIFLLSWVFSLLIHDSFIVAIIISLLFLLLVKPKSGSAMASVWFTDMPYIILEVFVVLTFGFWPALAILSITSLAGYVPLLIRSKIQS